MNDITPKDIPNCFYRVSIKALVLNESRDKFLIVQEEDGRWDVPGGGLDWGMTPQEDLPREISEEMGLKVVSIADNPCYFLCTYVSSGGFQKADVLYETELQDLNFTPSDECVAVKFIGKEDAKWLNEQNPFPNVPKLLEMFDPKNHQK